MSLACPSGHPLLGSRAAVVWLPVIVGVVGAASPVAAARVPVLAIAEVLKAVPVFSSTAAVFAKGVAVLPALEALIADEPASV